MSKEAIKLAIEWIEKQPAEITASKYDIDTRYAVLKELEEALTQEQGEPDLIECGNCHEGLADMEHVCKKCLGAGWVNNPKQEPVAWEQFHGHMAGPFYQEPPQGIYYTTPQQRKPLTLEQIREHWQVAKVLDMTDAEIDFADYVLITRDVEALHGIKE